MKRLWTLPPRFAIGLAPSPRTTAADEEGIQYRMDEYMSAGCRALRRRERHREKRADKYGIPVNVRSSTTTRIETSTREKFDGVTVTNMTRDDPGRRRRRTTAIILGRLFQRQ